MQRSPRRRIRLVAVAAGLMALPIRSDRSRHRQLDTSNGCQDHTVLPYAATSFVCMPESLTGNPPCDSVSCPTLPRPPHPLPRFVTIAIRPSCRERTGRAGSADLPDGLSEIFFRKGLDRFWVICPSGTKRAYEMGGTNEFGPGRSCQGADSLARPNSDGCELESRPRRRHQSAMARQGATNALNFFPLSAA
jgi:hypothetical protein